MADDRGTGPQGGRPGRDHPAADERQYNEYLVRVQDESGIDVRIALVPDTRGQPMKQFALRAMRELDVGREAGGRGLLIMYDTLAHAMRIEVGPKLEGILPDAFVGYLMREQVGAFFGGGRPELGLRTTLFMVHWHIRMARLGEEYDPSFEEYVRDVRRLASGGGASGRIGLDSAIAGFINTSGDAAASAYFRPQPSVEAAYRRHQEWLALGGGEVDVPLFTSTSQTYLRHLPMSPAFNAYLLAAEYGRRYAVDQRGDLAILYYTDDPFLSPKFFRRTPEGWQMDVFAEVANSQEAAGLWYTWRLRVSGDDFSRVFTDRFTPMDVPLVDDFYRGGGRGQPGAHHQGKREPRWNRRSAAGSRSPRDPGPTAAPPRWNTSPSGRRPSGSATPGKRCRRPAGRWPGSQARGEFDCLIAHANRSPKEAHMKQVLLVAALWVMSAVPTQAQDAVKVDPKHYKVEFENDQVRVLRISYGPGEKSVMHEHPANIAVFLADAKGRFTLPDGKSQEVSMKAGTTQWDAGGKHLPENVGDKGFELIVVELKSKPEAAR